MLSGHFLKKTWKTESGKSKSQTFFCFKIKILVKNNVFYAQMFTEWNIQKGIHCKTRTSSVKYYLESSCP